MQSWNVKVRNGIGMGLMFMLAPACKEEKKQEKSTPALAVAVSGSSDVSLTVPPNVETLDQQGIIDEVQNHSSTFTASSNEAGGDTADDSCTSKKLDTLNLEVTDTNIKYAGTLDLSDCVRETLEPTVKLLTLNLNFTMNLEYSCSAGGLIAFKGKKLSDISGSNLPCASGVMKNLITLVSKSLIKFQSGTSTYEFESGSETLEGMSGKTACEATLNGTSWNIKDGCIWAEKTVYSKYLVNGVADTTKRDTFFKAESKGLKQSKSLTAPWYESGAFDVQLSDWKGVVTNRGPDLAPTFEMKRGAEVAKGDFSAKPTSALGLTKMGNLLQLQLVRTLKLIK